MKTPELVASVAAEIDTDFAMLGLMPKWVEQPQSWILATSVGGALGLKCGSKNADLQVRVERWTSAPPFEAEDWEESDEIPLEPKDEEGPLRLVAFDEPPGVDRLDISGLGRARARVCVNGRSDRHTRDWMYEHTCEQWLVQLWPDPHRLDAMAGESRRLLPQSVPDGIDVNSLDLSASHTRLWTLQQHYMGAEHDLFHLMWWAPDQVLKSTPAQLATRLSIPVEQVAGGLATSLERGYPICDLDLQSLATLGADDPIELRRWG